MSLDQCIWQSGLKDLAKDILFDLPESEQFVQRYRNEIVPHAEHFCLEKVVLLLEEDSLFAYVKELYPDDSVWQAQDSWGTIHASYLFYAFPAWMKVIQEDIELLAESTLKNGDEALSASVPELLRTAKREKREFGRFLDLFSVAVKHHEL